MKISVEDIINDSDGGLREIARLAVEETLVVLRDSRISVLRNNGLTIKERDGSSSDVIRMGFERALIIGLRAILASQHEEVAS